MLLSMISFIITLIMILISVAFITLLERKILGYIQIRKGPNKVGIIGMFQPFADALKLFSKEVVDLEKANIYPFIVSPLMGLSMALAFWTLYPQMFYYLDMKWGILFFLCCSSISVYPLLSAGWSSNSKYALLGAYRGVAQTISYEISLALIIFSILLMVNSFNIFSFMNFQKSWPIGMLMIPLLLIWFVSCLAETNRTPFDFTEGESELVSGFNVEYMSVGFALIFMAEYANIIFMSMLTTMMFFSTSLLFMKLMMFCILFLWVRAAFPRFRYDKLMNLAWKSFLPISLIFTLLVCFMKTTTLIY